MSPLIAAIATRPASRTPRAAAWPPAWSSPCSWRAPLWCCWSRPIWPFPAPSGSYRDHLCFPFIFRGALDVGATTINEEMKLACVRAIAELARADVSDVVAAAYGRHDIRSGRST